MCSPEAKPKIPSHLRKLTLGERVHGQLPRATPARSERTNLASTEFRWICRKQEVKTLQSSMPSAVFGSDGAGPGVSRSRHLLKTACIPASAVAGSICTRREVCDFSAVGALRNQILA